MMTCLGARVSFPRKVALGELPPPFHIRLRGRILCLICFCYDKASGMQIAG